MKLATARKILEHYLGKDKVTVANRQLIAHHNKYVFSSYIDRDPTEITSLHVRHENDHSDPMSDYFAGHFYDTMPGVIRLFLNRSTVVKSEVLVEGAEDWAGNPAGHRLSIRLDVRMEGTGTKMRPVVHVDAELRLLSDRGDWPLAGSHKTALIDDNLLGLIDGKIEAKGDEVYDGIILDRLAEVVPDTYALYERLLETKSPSPVGG